MNHSPQQTSPLWLATIAILVLVTSLGCSLGRILVGEPTPAPTAVPPTPFPTWTPAPPELLSPAQIATLTVEAGLVWPTLTPTLTPIPTATPTWTPGPPVPRDTPTPALSPTPFITVQGEVVNVREGPSTAYRIIGRARAGDLYTVVGRNDASTWWQICCVDGSQGWIFGGLVTPGGTVGDVAVASAPAPPPPPPPAAPTNTPLPPPTPVPYQPFSIGDGPQFTPSVNAWLTIWVKVFKGQPNPNPPPCGSRGFYPVEGYRLRVLRNGEDVSKPDVSKPVFELSQPCDPLNPQHYGNRREYNLKYEYHPQAGTATWEIYLTDNGFNQLSPAITFETKEDGTLREVYVGFYDLR